MPFLSSNPIQAISAQLAKAAVIACVLVVAGCEQKLPEGFVNSKWIVTSDQAIHDALVKNEITDCGRPSPDKTETVYMFLGHPSNSGEYLVDCKKWFGAGHLYQVKTQTQEVTIVD